MANLKSNKVFFQFNTGTPGILFFKIVEELRGHIDVKDIGY
jgi:hypothetical protein